MRARPQRVRPWGRRGGALGAALAVLTLSGCFGLADGPALGPERRGDVPWLEGRFSATEGPAEITRVGVGVYRFVTRPAEEPDAEMVAMARLMAGDCTPPDGGWPQDLDLGGADPAVVCAYSVEQMCGDPALGFGDEPILCRAMLRLTRGAPAEPEDADFKDIAEAVAAPMRWLAEDRPWGDAVVFHVAPIPAPDGGAPERAVAQVIEIDSYGPYTDFAVFDAQLTLRALVLLEASPEGGFVAGTTSTCAEESGVLIGADGPEGVAPTLPAAAAFDVIADCAARGAERSERRFAPL